MDDVDYPDRRERMMAAAWARAEDKVTAYQQAVEDMYRICTREPDCNLAGEVLDIRSIIVSLNAKIAAMNGYRA